MTLNLIKTFVMGTSFLFFSSTVWSYDVAFLSPGKKSYWQVWLLNSETLKTKQLSRSPYDKTRVSWHSKGKKLLVNGQQGELVWLDRRSGRETAIDTPLRGFNDAYLSPDDTQIVFSLSTSESKNDNNIWLYDLEKHQQNKVTNLPELQHQPYWPRAESKAEQSVYFLSGKGGETHDIWKVDVQNREATQLTHDNLYHFDLNMSSKGLLAYAGNQQGNYDLWLVEDEFGSPRQLTDTRDAEGHPFFSPDGDRLMYDKRVNGISNLWIIDVKTKKATQVTQFDSGAMRPVWYSKNKVILDQRDSKEKR